MTGVLEALIFDFDGLILDTEYPEYRAWELVYQNHGLSLPAERWAENIGRGASDTRFNPYDELERLVGRVVDRDALRAGRRAHFAELMEAELPRPGVRDWLNAARERGMKCVIASSSPRLWITGYLARHGLEGAFDAIRCADDVTRTKPDPEVYRAALEAVGVSADRALALEDSPNGIAAAKAAGLFCIAVPNHVTRHLPLSAADLLAESLAELTLDMAIHRVARHKWDSRAK